MMNSEIVMYLALLVMQGAILYFAQRRLFSMLMHHLKYRKIVYLLLAPGTILHELAHFFMAVMLFVRGIGPVRLFWPHTLPDGGAVLGYVGLPRLDPIRMTLISIAPVLLIPPVIYLALNYTVGIPLEYGASSWQFWVALLAVLLTAGAAFPSPGDQIGISGTVVLAGIIFILVKYVDIDWNSTLALANLLYAPASIANLAVMLLFSVRR